MTTAGGNRKCGGWVRQRSSCSSQLTSRGTSGGALSSSEHSSSPGIDQNDRGYMAVEAELRQWGQQAAGVNQAAERGRRHAELTKELVEGSTGPRRFEGQWIDDDRGVRRRRRRGRG